MPWSDGKIRYVEEGTVKLADGREFPVVAALMLKTEPDSVPGFSYDRHTTWVGSLHTDTDDSLLDAAPGLLTLPSGRCGTFMAVSGPADTVGVSGIGPAPFGPVHDLDAVWKPDELGLDEVPPGFETEEDPEWAALQALEREQRRGA